MREDGWPTGYGMATAGHNMPCAGAHPRDATHRALGSVMPASQGR